MSSTSATVAARSHKVGRTLLTTFSRRGTTAMPSLALVAGNADARRAATALASAVAWSRETPSRSRAKTRSERPARSLLRAASESGRQRVAFVAQKGANRNDAGMTPTTVNGSPSSVTVRPTMPRSPPNRRFHNASLSTTTRSRPGWSSPATKVRPSAAGTPSVRNKSAVTCRPGRRSAPSPDASVALHACAAEIPS